MASLSSILLSADRIKGGAWVPVHTPTGDTFDIRTRGFTPAYRDALAQLRLDAARDANKGAEPGQWIITPDTLPPSVADGCQAKALIAHCLLDIRGLFHDDAGAKPVTLAEFTALMLDPISGAGIVRLVAEAAGSVTIAREDQVREAVGNSPAA